MRPRIYKDNDPSVLYLSPSGLGDMLKCEKCFLLDKGGLGIKQPAGIFPGLPSGMDDILKLYHDGYREKAELPPYLATKVPGLLYANQSELKKMQNWKTGLRYEAVIDKRKVCLRGAIDDLITRFDGNHSTFDFKTKRKEPQDDGSQYYQTQLDCYELLLEHNEFPMSGVGFLAYTWPAKATTPDDLSLRVDVDFQWKVYALNTSSTNALTLLDKAVEIINRRKAESSPDCQYCNYHTQRSEIDIISVPLL